MANNNPILVIGVDEDDFALLILACNNAKIPNQLIRLQDGHEGIEYLKTNKDKPFIILTEIYMPGMSGIDFRKTIEADKDLRSKSVPFIFLSETLLPQQVTDVYSMSVQGLFEKQDSLEILTKIMSVIYEYWQRCRHPDERS